MGRLLRDGSPGPHRIRVLDKEVDNDAVLATGQLGDVPCHWHPAAYDQDRDKGSRYYIVVSIIALQLWAVRSFWTP